MLTRSLKLLSILCLFNLNSYSSANPNSIIINTQPENRKIVGGEDAIRGEFPFMVSLQIYNNNHFCGGSIISSRYILTAAHCVASYSVQSIVVGKHATYNNNGATTIRVKRQIVHPQYDAYYLYNDVALLELENDIPYKYKPIQLANEYITSTYAGQGMYTTVIGWGDTQGTGNPYVLQKVDVPITSTRICQNAGGIYSNICAGLPQGGKDSCQGDSGGPLFIKTNNDFYQVGIVSFGSGCAQPNQPGVYARVANFKLWIEQYLTQRDKVAIAY